ncbi:MAG: hypothetical protein C0514_02100 [Candidatus Puniceispirillum sp.]|nr:hypothetical protein [Candidatus Puniceispirillum sp.]
MIKTNKEHFSLKHIISKLQKHARRQHASLSEQHHFFSQTLLLTKQTLPFRPRTLFLAAVFLAVGCFTVFAIQYKVDMRAESLARQHQAQQAYDAFATRVDAHLRFAAKVYDHKKTSDSKGAVWLALHRLTAYPMTLIKGQEPDSVTFGPQGLLFKKALGENMGTLSIHVSYAELAQKLSVPHISTSTDKGHIQTAAGTLYFPDNTPSFLADFANAKFPRAFMTLLEIYGAAFLTLITYTLLVSRGRKSVSCELASLHNKVTNLTAHSQDLEEEITTLKVRLAMKARADNALTALQKKHVQRGMQNRKHASSLCALLQHVLRAETLSPDATELLSKIKLTLQEGHDAFTVSAPANIDPSHTLARVQHILSPFMARSRLVWECHVEEGFFSMTTDPYLFEIFLLLMCKDMLSFAYPHSVLRIMPHSNGLTVTLHGERVVAKRTFADEAIDLGFICFSRTSLPKLASALHMQLSHNNTHITLTFLDPAKSTQDAHLSHDNVVPLFA